MKTDKCEGEYDPSAIEITKAIPSGAKAEGVISNIKSGKVSDFVDEESRDKWKGNLEQPAIELEVTIDYESKEFKVKKLFTYDKIKGKMVFSERSNLGKFNKYYKKMPTIGQKVNCLTNSEGFFRLLIE